jgi:cytochrome b subunit of formate dehydrogenase
VIIVNFTGLVITGFSLSLSHYQWTRFVVSLIGGASTAGSFHRFFAVSLYLGIVIHFAWLLYYKFGMKGKLTGPESVMPSRKDFADLYQNLRYIFGKGTPPLFDRFSYLQKVDYWAVMLGMQSMGITGLLMWFPEFFSTFLPGHWINVATHFHFHEAILAVMYIGLVHMSDTHLLPEVFPLEKSIFTGKISTEKLRREHPEEWKRMNSENPGN